MISFDVIKSLIRTEKSSSQENNRKYLFLVNKAANKIQIKKAVEDIYKVKVEDVNTFISAGKLKRVRHELGRTTDIKKAIVTLHEGNKIEIA
jgi:large subunit ribosomal protein L23